MERRHLANKRGAHCFIRQASRDVAWFWTYWEFFGGGNENCSVESTKIHTSLHHSASIDASCLKFCKLFFHESDVDYATTKQWRLLTLYTVITHAQFQSRLIRNRGDKINHIFGIHNPDLPIHYTLQYAYGGCSFGPNFDDFGDNIGFWYEFKWYNPKRHIIEWFHIFELQHVKISTELTCTCRRWRKKGR